MKSDKPVFSTAATMDPAASIASTNKVLSNTYWLLGLTLAFSAFTATVAVVANVPQGMALVLMLVGFGLLFVVHKMADSAKGQQLELTVPDNLAFSMPPHSNQHEEEMWTGEYASVALSACAVAYAQKHPWHGASCWQSNHQVEQVGCRQSHPQAV